MSKIVEVKKNDLRLAFRQAAAVYLRRPDVSMRLVENLQNILPKSARIGAFRAKSDEVSIDPLLDGAEYRFAYPRVQGDDLIFYETKSTADFVLSELGIQEPHPLKSDRVHLAELDVLLIPGVAFDRKLTRLGRGRGFYDRALENYQGLKIGIASSAQVSNEDLPRAHHDVVMDLLVTDQFILKRFDS